MIKFKINIQGRIQDFKWGGANMLIGQNFLETIYENEENRTGATHSIFYYVDPPLEQITTDTFPTLIKEIHLLYYLWVASIVMNYTEYTLPDKAIQFSFLLLHLGIYLLLDIEYGW